MLKPPYCLYSEILLLIEFAQQQTKEEEHFTSVEEFISDKTID